MNLDEYPHFSCHRHNVLSIVQGWVIFKEKEKTIENGKIF